jgi:hypothetical protein
MVIVLSLSRAVRIDLGQTDLTSRSFFFDRFGKVFERRSGKSWGALDTPEKFPFAPA